MASLGTRAGSAAPCSAWLEAASRAVGAHACGTPPMAWAALRTPCGTRPQSTAARRVWPAPVGSDRAMACTMRTMRSTVRCTHYATSACYLTVLPQHECAMRCDAGSDSADWASPNPNPNPNPTPNQGPTTCLG
jgi:hypothetical protein